MKASRKIRWRGEIASDKQWRVLSKLKNGYQDSLFTSVAVAQNVAKPLVKYIDNALVGEGASKAKVTLLVGHDSNIASLLTAPTLSPINCPASMSALLSAANCCFSAGMTAPAIAI